MSVDVVVVVPAHDEEERVATTVLDVRRALAHARRLGEVRRSRVVVVAHRCTDRTAVRAAGALATDGEVLVDERAATVGEVRDHGVRVALARVGADGGDPAATWVLCTDADTRVPVGWVADVLRCAAASRAVGVVGLAGLSDRLLPAHARAAYRRLVAAKLRDTSGLDQHGHVYGANLAVRADAYLAVGGFPRVRVGEDQALVDALTAAGLPLARTGRVRVHTSARLVGRAAGGLADELAGLVRG
ncbi:MAG: glycosyltransferase [Nocardioidaceae bacterium]|nr:glycosyltransferase [Nocardioidaceae bacterium]NUS51617.1 glycosyltransferase [Nocardioidaceae bacterium]